MKLTLWGSLNLSTMEYTQVRQRFPQNSCFVQQEQQLSNRLFFLLKRVQNIFLMLNKSRTYENSGNIIWAWCFKFDWPANAKISLHTCIVWSKPLLLIHILSIYRQKKKASDRCCMGCSQICKTYICLVWLILLSLLTFFLQIQAAYSRIEEIISGQGKG